MKNFLKSKKWKLILILSLWTLTIGSLLVKNWIIKSNTNTNTNKEKIITKTTNNTNKNTVKSNVNNNTIVFKKIVKGFDNELTTELPLQLYKKEQKGKLLFLYYKCLPYNKITNKMLSNVMKLSNTKQDIGEKDLFKKQYQRICNKILYTQYPVTFVYSNSIVWNEDVLPAVLLKSLERYLSPKELVDYNILKTFFSYNKIGLIGIIKWRKLWVNSYVKMIKSLKWRKLDPQTIKDIKEFKKVITTYLK